MHSLESAPPAFGPPASPALARQLGVWSAIAIVVGAMIGSGIFRVPSATAAQVGTPGGMMLVWVGGGGVALCGALALAELAALYPRAGGIYVYLNEAYGSLLAFLMGWLFLVIAPVSIGAVALVFAEYLGRLFPVVQEYTRLVAAAAVALVAGWNSRSLRFGASITNLSSAAKVLAILVLTAAAFLSDRPGGAEWLGAGELAPASWTGFGLGLVTVLWAYNGWQDATYIGGEVRQAGRTLPRALVLGTLIVTGVYLAVNAAYLAVLPLEEIAQSPLVAADVAVRLVGEIGNALIAALVCVSTFGTMNGGTLCYPRVFYAMAEDRVFFRGIAAVHPRYGTPHAAILLTAALAICFLWVRTFEQLIEVFILGSLPFWALAAGAVILLRRRRPDLERPYRCPGYPVVPVLFILATMGLLLNSFYQRPGPTIASFGAILAGVPVYYLWRRR
ncbi:MAG TPA: amino acid permease [Gemmatimonadales bacterium]|jgi:amino acid transporter|nr:amino acid permease [Gemmatimonadales bacterium]